MEYIEGAVPINMYDNISVEDLKQVRGINHEYIRILGVESCCCPGGHLLEFHGRATEDVRHQPLY